MRALRPGAVLRLLFGVLLVAGPALVAACRDATVPDTPLAPEQAVLVRPRTGSLGGLTAENSAWERRNVAADSADCQVRDMLRFREKTPHDRINRFSCPSQVVVSPKRSSTTCKPDGDRMYPLAHYAWFWCDSRQLEGWRDTISVAFSSPVGMLAILSEGLHDCNVETYSSVVAYGPGNVELGRTTFRLIPMCPDVSDPSVEPSGPFAEAILPIPSGVTRLVIAPPEVWTWRWPNPWRWDTGSPEFLDLHYESEYRIIFRPDVGQPAPTVEIVSAGGPNPGGSFIVRAPENVITLEARVTPAAYADSVTWEVTGMPLHDAFMTVAPDSVPRGARTSFVVPAENRRRTRWPVAGRVPHDPLTAAQKASDLTKKSLRYRITAKVTANGQSVRSLPVTVQQDEIDTMREEYVEFGQQRVLERTDFGTFGDSLRNRTGDYTLWPSGPRLVEKMPIMQQLAIRRSGRPITVMSGYRNPVHHYLHALATAPESQHLYGNATDWVITDPNARPSSLSKDEGFTRLWEMTRHPSVDGCWEPAAEIIRTSHKDRALQTLNHAHSDWRVMTRTSCVPEWRLR